MDISSLFSSTYNWIKHLPWDVIILVLLFFSALGQYFISKEDEKVKDKIKNNTTNLIKKGKETLDNLNAISINAKIAQKAANEAYSQLDDTYTNTLLGIEKAEENNKGIIENLKNTIKAKDDILKSQEEMISKLTGGNSYPFITILNNTLQLHLDGDYGIPELRIEIVFFKNYLKQNSTNCKKYIEEGLLNDEIIKFYDHTFTKLYVNKRYQSIIIPNEILESIVNDNYAGFDIKFNSGYKSWTQYIRLHKYGINTKQIEIFNILYESKEKRATYPEDLVKRLKIEASPNYKDFNNDFKKINNLEKSLDYVVVFYPEIERIEFKEKEVDQTLSYLTVNQFKPTK